MSSLLKNWRIIVMLAFLLIAIFVVFGRGLQFGIDFKGGTMFQIELAKPILDIGERSRVIQTVQQRLDWTGLRDTTVSFFGDSFVIAQIAETDPGTIERIEALLKKQGVFEATIDGNVIFPGEDIVELPKDPAQGYGLYKEGDSVRWSLPFVLKSTAAQRFTRLTFHRCELVSFSPDAGRQYECDKTYFFIDRPKDAVLVMPIDLYDADERMFLDGVQAEGISEGTKIEEIMLNSQVPYLLAKDKNFSQSDLAELQSLAAGKKAALVPESLPENMLQQLASLGFEVRKVALPSGKPFLLDALGLRSIIGLSESVAQMDVAVVEDAKPMDKLQIFGYAGTAQQAEQRRADLEILLQSGSLSVSVKSISKETISPLLGENFLQSVAIMGLLAVITVAMVIFVRYRAVKLLLPITIISIIEVFITVALSSLISKFDLGAVAGIIAAVGTGVDDQIVITDELIRGRKGSGQDSVEAGSQITRMKRAFFIVVAAASTMIAAMAPIILIGFGLGKLVGFAITTIIGILVGVLITRPAFGEIIKEILGKN